jgi:hypothetical protein
VVFFTRGQTRTEIKIEVNLEDNARMMYVEVLLLHIHIEVHMYMVYTTQLLLYIAKVGFSYRICMLSTCICM